MKLLALLVTVGGCVLSPLDQEAVRSRVEPLQINGYGADARAKIVIKSWDFDRVRWEPIEVRFTGTSAVGRDTPLFYWHADNVLLGKRYWHSSSAPCSATGMGRLEVSELYEGTLQALGTFTRSGQECLNDQILAGADYYEAGAGCYTGRNILMFAAGECATIPAASTAPTQVVLRLNDGDMNAWSAANGTFTVIADVDASRTLRVTGDAFDRDGVRTIVVNGDVTLTCASGSTTVPRYFTYLSRNDQPGGVGSTVDKALGTAFDVTLPAFRSWCWAGWTATRVDGWFRATATDFHGVSTASPQQYFQTPL